jgi:hypothetical protein
MALPVQRGGGDVYGITAAVVCALHCVAGPLLAAAAPALALAWLEHPGLEWGLVATSIIASSAAMASGWRRHRRWSPLPLLCFGVATLLVARLGPELAEDTERMVVASAATALVLAHLVNLRLLRRTATGASPR